MMMNYYVQGKSNILKGGCITGESSWRVDGMTYKHILHAVGLS